MGRQGTAFVLCLLALFFAGCGSGGGGNGGPPPAPVITGVSPSSPVAVTIGSTQKFSIQSTGIVTSLTCTSQLFGNVPVSGSTASYTPPASSTPPASFNDTLTFTASNAGGQNQAMVAIVLENPTPAITSVSPQTMYLGRSGAIVGNVTYNGSGFAGGSSFAIVPNPSVVTTNSPGVTSSNQFLLNFAIGVNTNVGGGPFDPGYIGASITPPAGHGGNTSNVENVAFLGDQDTLACSPTECFQLDQGSGIVWIFKRSDGSLERNITVGRSETGIAFDNKTGLIVLAGIQGIAAFDPATGAHEFGADAKTSVLGVDAADGWACFAEPFANALGCVQIVPFTVGTPTTISIAGTPWNVSMTSLSGNLTAVVWSIESDTLTMVSVLPSLSVAGSVALSGLTPNSKVPIFQGGWQLQMFDSGPSQGNAAVLAQADNTVVFVNLATMTETKRAKLQGVTFRMGKNEADGSVVVALADTADGLTKFVKVAPDGTVTPLTSAVPFLATGFQVSTDGTQLFCANRGVFQIVANR
ncbi:MAG: hypothetical protein ACRD50_03585 [Candidatus Acidiferrales bacterium]